MIRTAALGILLLMALAASAHAGPPDPLGGDPASDSAGMPAPVLRVGFDQRLGEQVPLDLEFSDEQGQPVRLGDLFQGRPVILSLAYYSCPMLCGLSLQGIASSLKTLTFDAGKEFQVITVSFDPRDTPAEARTSRSRSLDLYGRPGAAQGWRFLTGGEDAIRRLTGAVGFRYEWDEEQKQYAHATGIVLLTPAGRIARYFFGVEYAPKDLRLGLVEAAEGRIGTLADRLLLLCYQYDPKTGRYSGLALGLVRAGGAATALALGLLVAATVWRETRRKADPRARGRSDV